MSAADPRPPVGTGRNEPHIKAQNNTHRTPGRAQLPTHHAQRAARGLGGAAVLGGVVLGTAFTGGAAQTRGALNGAGVSTGGASVASSSSSSSSSLVDAARSAVGTTYSWGGSSLSGMDCSGLVVYAYEAAGIDVPRTSSQQTAQGRSISQSEAQPGDLVVWPGHIAIYAGNGQIIDASGSQQERLERGI